MIALAVAGADLAGTPQYASSAQLFVSTSPSDTADAYQGSLFASQRVTSYADLVGSRELANGSPTRWARDPAAELVGTVEATVVPETVILDSPPRTRTPCAPATSLRPTEGLSDLVRTSRRWRAEMRPRCEPHVVDDGTGVELAGLAPAGAQPRAGAVPRPPDRVGLAVARGAAGHLGQDRRRRRGVTDPPPRLDPGRQCRRRPRRGRVLDDITRGRGLPRCCAPTCSTSRSQRHQDLRGDQSVPAEASRRSLQPGGHPGPRRSAGRAGRLRPAPAAGRGAPPARRRRGDDHGADRRVPSTTRSSATAPPASRC